MTRKLNRNLERSSLWPAIVSALPDNQRPRLRDAVVRPLDKDQCVTLVEQHHYSRKCPGIKHGYGLFEMDALVGCCVFSIPASYTLCRGVCGTDFTKYVLELSRLVITTQARNAASFLIGHSIKKLPDSVVVSYADCNDHVGHVGYVYQATNWLYTGHGSAEPCWVDPRNNNVISYTRRHIDTKAAALGLDWHDLIKVPQRGKHRYVLFAGSKSFKKRARSALRYAVHPYPKGTSRKHSAAALVTGRPIE